MQRKQSDELDFKAVALVKCCHFHAIVVNLSEVVDKRLVTKISLPAGTQ